MLSSKELKPVSHEKEQQAVWRTALCCVKREVCSFVSIVEIHRNFSLGFRCFSEVESV
jgi:hypothetical protein